MKPSVRIVIIAVLVVLVGGLLWFKQSGNPLPAETDRIASPAAESGTPLPRLVDLGADKCIPCKMMAPILEDLKTTYKGQFEVVFIDVWKHPEAAEPYGIKLIPTQIFFDATGRELFRHQGFFSKEEILAKWEALGVRLKHPEGKD